MTPQALVLDSWAVIAYLEDEPCAARIADWIAEAHEADRPVLMSVVNAGEVWYTIAREISEAEAEACIQELRDLRIQFVDVDWNLTREAARFKSQHRLSYADCYAAALAKQEQAELVTGDREFEALAGEVTIVWA